MPPTKNEDSSLATWYPIQATVRGDAWAKELRSELSKTQLLYGMSARAVGALQDCDDVAFELTDGRLAVVHLTYAQHPESNPV